MSTIHVPDTIKQASAVVQEYTHVEDIQQLNNQGSSLQHDTTTVTTTSDINETTLRSALLEIETLKRKLKEANEKLQIADKVVSKTQKTKKNLLHLVRKLKSQKRLRVEKSILNASKILRTVFNKDQIEWLQNFPRRKVYKWSEETIKKALRIKFSCSENGYKELINQNIPLPSTRTLRRSIEAINFQPGICDDIFQILRYKVSQFQDDREKDCMLALDEISLAPGEQNDASTNSFIGYATITNSRGK